MDLKLLALAFCLAFAICANGAVASESAQAPKLELWLASGPECNSCEIFAEVAKRRGYANEVRYRRNDELIVIPIKRVDKAALPTNVLSQLSGDSGPSSRH